jgi:selenide,water dikinase
MEATRELVAGLPIITNPNLLVGADTLDDAGVYKISEDMALVLTLDLFPPVVDDPLHYGRISAVNSLSDVYAMGGTPIAVMNIFTYPFHEVAPEVGRQILLGGGEKIKEAGAVLAGGHTMRDSEFKYGLSVVGTVHPQKIIKNMGAKEGDDLVLTKPLGIGIITTAIKKELIDEENPTLQKAIQSMEQLNRASAEAMQETGVHAATDVTGFGLLGHAYTMAQNSKVSFEFFSEKIPIIPGSLDFLNKGAWSGGSQKNKETVEKITEKAKGISEELFKIACDAQTSGGMFVSIASEKTKKFLETLRKKGVEGHIIGRVLPAQKKWIIFGK